MSTQIYHPAAILTSPDPGTLECHEREYIVVEEGIIEGIYKELPASLQHLPIEELEDCLLIPAFSDLHIHASQFTERGTGMDLLLFDWLNEYTFPQEASFQDVGYARQIYPQVIYELLKHGTMHAAFFTTIHYDACDLFWQMLQESGMYALSGKVNMDRNSPDYLCESTADSLRDTERFLQEHPSTDRLKAVLIPRFAPTCSEELLKGLGELSRKYKAGLHTHLVESRAESAWTKELFPDYQTDGDIYDRLGLLGNGPAVFAHVIFPEERDLEVLKKYDACSVHCPDATVNVTAGIMPLKKMQDEGYRIALGTDIGGGHSPALYTQAVRSVQESKIKEFYEGEGERVSFREAFYHATHEGGAVFGRTGQLKKGYRFNALALNGLEDGAVKHTPQELLERFCYLGDDRHIVGRWLDGKKIDPEEIRERISRL